MSISFPFFISKKDANASRAAPGKAGQNIRNCLETVSPNKIFDFGASPKIRCLRRKFRICGIMKTLACLRITLLIRNIKPWYFQEMIFKDSEATWLQNVSEIQWFQYRKQSSKIGNAWVVQAQVVEQSLPLVQLLFGATTLRITCMRAVNVSTKVPAPRTCRDGHDMRAHNKCEHHKHPHRPNNPKIDHTHYPKLRTHQSKYKQRNAHVLNGDVLRKRPQIHVSTWRNAKTQKNRNLVNTTRPWRTQMPSPYVKPAVNRQPGYRPVDS